MVDSATKRALKAAKQQTQTSAELAQQHESAVHVNGKHEAGQRSVAHSKSHELITSWLNDIDPSASSPSHESLDYRKNPAHTFDDEEYTIHSPGLKFNICPTSADPIPTNAYAAPPPVFGLTGVASASAFSSSSSSSSSATGEPAAAATPAYLQSYCNRWQIPMSSVAAALSPARETLRLRGKKQGQEKEPKRKMRAEAENGNENIALLPFMSAKEIEDAKASFRQYFDSTGTGAGSPRVREDSVLGTVDMNVVTKVDVTTPIYGTAGPNDDMTKSTYATARVTPSTPTQHVCSDPAHDADGERDLTPLSPTISLHRGDSDARRRREKKEGKKRCPSYSDRDIISSPGRLTSQGWVWLGR